MSIHREGYKILFSGLVVLVVLNIVARLILSPGSIIPLILLGVSVLIYCFLVFFFRLPQRSFVQDDSIIIAPADGKVVVIENTMENEYFHDERIQVSIFMSPFNMHSNRYPVSGIVKYVKYHPGKFLVAWHPKSSDLNERASVVIETPGGHEILVRQVAGAVARRIVTYSKKGSEVKQGDELGFIKFGSRVDLFLPNDCGVIVPLLQQVRANRDMIARLSIEGNLQSTNKTGN